MGFLLSPSLFLFTVPRVGIAMSYKENTTQKISFERKRTNGIQVSFIHSVCMLYVCIIEYIIYGHIRIFIILTCMMVVAGDVL